jgi:apolipoprotein D and lipocalin family protein
VRLSSQIRSLVLSTLLAALSSASATLLVGCDSPPPLETAPNVDLTRFEGSWFEIAHLPRPTQASCAGTTATYTSRGNGQYTFVHACTLANGNFHQASALAQVKDSANPAKLEVDFGGFFGDYWILDVAPDYHYAVIGHPSRAYLWILSRSSKLTPSDQQQILDKATSLKFDVSKLEYTKHD